jgi:DNA polymerase-3 subunit delta'
MTDEAIPEADRVAGLPHPRETGRLLGHEAAEEAFLAAIAGGRLHHAWLVAGPEGIGKATLCWRVARFLLCRPPVGEADGLFGAPPAAATLDIDPAHPVARRMQALAEPRLFLLRRPWDDKTGRLRSEITVDEVRRMKSFFGLSAADGGTRVAIIDSADDLNPSAANALLKLLEEPPADAVFLLVSHQPARLLPTIRSRCRTMRLGPLGPDALAGALAAALGTAQPDAAQTRAIAELAGGSVGAAARLVGAEGAGLYGEIVALCAGMPGVDRLRLVTLAERLGARGAEARFDLAVRLLDRLLARAARHGATGTAVAEAAAGEAGLLGRLAPDAAAGRRWAELAQTLGQRVRVGRAVNLDPAALLVDMVLKIDAEAGRLARR